MVTLAPPWNRITPPGPRCRRASRRLSQDGLSVREVRDDRAGLRRQEARVRSGIDRGGVDAGSCTARVARRPGSRPRRTSWSSRWCRTRRRRSCRRWGDRRPRRRSRAASPREPMRGRRRGVARARVAGRTAWRTSRRMEMPAPSPASARFNSETSTEPETSTATNADKPAISARRCNDHSLRFPLGSAESRRRGRLSRGRCGGYPCAAGCSNWSARRSARSAASAGRPAATARAIRRSSRSTPAWTRSGELLTSGSSRLTARSSRSTAETGSRRARYAASEITLTHVVTLDPGSDTVRDGRERG